MSLPPMWLSPFTKYIRPTATPDNSSNNNNAAISVNPF